MPKLHCQRPASTCREEDSGNRMGTLASGLCPSSTVKDRRRLAEKKTVETGWAHSPPAYAQAPLSKTGVDLQRRRQWKQDGHTRLQPMPKLHCQRPASTCREEDSGNRMGTLASSLCP